MQKASPSWQEAKDWQWQEACRRETVIRPLAEQGRVSRQEAAAAAERLRVKALAARRAFKRQSERCSKAATTLDLSENPGEKTLMHLLRDLTAKWGFRSGFNCKIGLPMRCSPI